MINCWFSHFQCRDNCNESEFWMLRFLAQLQKQEWKISNCIHIPSLCKWSYIFLRSIICSISRMKVVPLEPALHLNIQIEALLWLFCGVLWLTNPTGSSRREFINSPQQPIHILTEIINQSLQPGQFTVQRINGSENWWDCTLIYQAVTYSRPFSLSIILADWQGQRRGQQPELEGPTLAKRYNNAATVGPATSA